jgi:hypothetical protein
VKKIWRVCWAMIRCLGLALVHVFTFVCAVSSLFVWGWFFCHLIALESERVLLIFV